MPIARPATSLIARFDHETHTRYRNKSNSVNDYSFSPATMQITEKIPVLNIANNFSVPFRRSLTVFCGDEPAYANLSAP